MSIKSLIKSSFKGTLLPQLLLTGLILMIASEEISHLTPQDAGTMQLLLLGVIKFLVVFIGSFLGTWFFFLVVHAALARIGKQSPKAYMIAGGIGAVGVYYVLMALIASLSVTGIMVIGTLFMGYTSIGYLGSKLSEVLAVSAPYGLLAIQFVSAALVFAVLSYLFWHVAVRPKQGAAA